MMALRRAESTWEIDNHGKYINQFPPNIIKSIQQYERINKKICRQKISILFNEICINEEMLPKYIYTHTHTHIYIYIYIQRLTYISMKLKKRLGELKILGRIDTFQTTALLKSTRILRRAEETCYNSELRETISYYRWEKLAIIMIIGR